MHCSQTQLYVQIPDEVARLHLPSTYYKLQESRAPVSLSSSYTIPLSVATSNMPKWSQLFIITSQQPFPLLLSIRIISFTQIIKHYDKAKSSPLNVEKITQYLLFIILKQKQPFRESFAQDYIYQSSEISEQYKLIINDRCQNSIRVFDKQFYCMDPRPYHYEYRRPRPNNLTYQSIHAGQSIYHMGKQQFYNSNNILRDQHAQRINRYSPNYSNPYQMPQRRSYCEMGVNTDSKSNRSISSNYSQRSKSSASQKSFTKKQQPSILSNYGSNSLNKQQANGADVNIVFTNKNDTSMIYKKQQRPFDIINLYYRPREALKIYPKLTRQHLFYDQESLAKAT